ncbi:Crp/Fnr family transcriptional regulator [Sphingomonas oligophenolica]|uniref:Crp/Fnr family transcriptional regulator n=1 Tax=Sphingomonas oligophenolica TaxID=301154 RepID=A0A502CUB3_9SPHN|nr:Crp/Fnr family transcriptional regulator [Sphingomonas oligophenolica]TPG15709.1 Crp/Fnr family transcriptional regulator [Sphingomonas oligophenolica]
MEDLSPRLDRFFQKLRSREALIAADVDAIRALPFKLRTLTPSQYMVREGQLPQRFGIICDGFAYRQKLTIEGDRQIAMILVPGDMLDLPNLFLRESDHDIQALTALTMAEVPLEAVRELVLARPMIARALWTDSLVEGSITREWLLNVGRRNARTRIAHLLCEFQLRLESIGQGEAEGYELPMTQEQLGDALGLTPVHVNRMLQSLEREGLIHRRQRRIKVQDWPKLRLAGQFNQRYLHLTNVKPSANF